MADGPKVLKSFGPFELVEKVGLGGMGSVYKARRPGREEFVAIKIASRKVAIDPVLSQRFRNEFKAASELEHPHLVRALGYGVENHFQYLVMEFVPGRSLQRLLKEQGPLSLAEARSVFEQVASALAYIHQHHLIHRDIKPGNILIDPSGQAKLSDLGLIKDLDSDKLLTNSRMGLGTLEYAAPEQFDDAKNADLRCDIYALAASFYVAVTGKFPFGPGSQTKVLEHKLGHQFTPLSQLIEGVSAALDQMIARALHPDPEMRPASVTEFLEGLTGTEAVGTPLSPKPLEPIPATVEERRSDIRHPVQFPATVGLLNALSRDAWPAQIMDISAGGLCVLIGRRFEANTILNVHLPDPETGLPTSRLVRTCWTKPMPDKNWLIGCLFVSPLESEELDRFLFGDMSQTNMLGNK